MIKSEDKIDVIQNVQDKINEFGLEINVELQDIRIFDEFIKNKKIIKINQESIL